MQLEQIRVDTLIPYVRNARTHKPEQVQAIAASIKEFGFMNPIIIGDDNGIIAGHGRLMAAQLLGLTNVPCLRASHLTPAQRQAYVLVDNRLTDTSSWDTELLRVELSDLANGPVDLAAVGFSPAEIEAMLGSPLEPESRGAGGPAGDLDDIQIEAPARAAVGDLWLLGEHRLFCGDSTVPDNLAALLGRDRVDMVFTDPPYGIGFDKQGQRMGKAKRHRAVLNDHDNATAVKAYALARELTTGPLFFWGANHYCSALPASPCWIVWDKQGGKHVDHADVELCFCSINAPARLFTHIWDGFRRDSEKGESRIHPTQKPVQLFCDIWAFFEKYTKDAHNVLDFFGGSGSTLMACHAVGKRCLMAELDPCFVDLILARWEHATGGTAILLERAKSPT